MKPDTPKPGPGRPRHESPSAAYLARHQEIIDTAARVFSEKGYAQGSLEDVADEMGLRKSALYYYVRSKDELLYRIFDQTISKALDHFASLRETEDPTDRLAAMIRFQVTMVVEQLDYIAVFFDQRPQLHDDYVARFRVKESQYLDMFVQSLQDAIDREIMPPIDVRTGAQGILGMTSWVYKWFDPQRDDPERIVGSFLQMLGLPSPKGSRNRESGTLATRHKDTDSARSRRDTSHPFNETGATDFNDHK